MNAKARKALKLSIAHWTRLATGKRKPGEGVGRNDCALCGLFWTRSGACLGCPVSNKTGVGNCRKTPHDSVVNAVLRDGYDTAQFKAAARKELTFLQSLIPK